MKNIVQPLHTPLMVIVGWSGSGKSTFIEAMDCPDHHFIISGSIRKELLHKGVSVNHDSIMEIAHERYQKDPLWQVDSIIELLKQKGYLIVDGSRNSMEIKELVKRNSETLVIWIDADEFARYEQLHRRGDNILPEDFRRIMKDESELTDLNEIYESLVDVKIKNKGYLERLRAIGKMFGIFLRSTAFSNK
jgi:dephospho-CoA kinase